MIISKDRVYESSRFGTMREWLFFCMEYELEICWGCQRCARKREHGDDELAWYCPECPTAVHPDLWHAVRTRSDVKTSCAACHQQIPLREAWVSEDCQRIYCQSHLEPIKPEDRLRETRRFLVHRERESSLAPAHPVSERLRFLRKHLHGMDCGTCAFNGRGVYFDGHLYEMDRGDRRCDCAPDTLNCAGLEC